tara:strand:+ start:129 stop:422 length:294 start_codon:yes stop_codon:yes gene_type:complete
MDTNIIKNINSILLKKYDTYTTIWLDEKLIIDNDFTNIRKILLDILDVSNSRIYISKTFICDSINVLDLNGIKFIEFENDEYKYENKGLNNFIEIKL